MQDLVLWPIYTILGHVKAFLVILVFVDDSILTFFGLPAWATWLLWSLPKVDKSADLLLWTPLVTDLTNVSALTDGEKLFITSSHFSLVPLAISGSHSDRDLTLAQLGFQHPPLRGTYCGYILYNIPYIKYHTFDLIEWYGRRNVYWYWIHYAVSVLSILQKMSKIFFWWGVRSDIYVPRGRVEDYPLQKCLPSPCRLQLAADIWTGCSKARIVILCKS